VRSTITYPPITPGDAAWENDLLTVIERMRKAEGGSLFGPPNKDTIFLCDVLEGIIRRRKRLLAIE